MQYTFFDGETKNEITCAEFFSALRSFLAFETQGRKVADVVDELVAHHVLPEGTPVPRLLSEFEARHIARHFFGSDAGSVPRNGAFDEFLKWLRGTVDVLKNPPYNELFARGLIFLGLNAPEELLESSEIEFGTFFIVSELKVPGSMGIVVKSREGVLKRPLVCYNSTVSSVAASLMRACELKEMLEITLREVVVCDKAMCLGQLASSETEDPYAGTEFTDPPFVV